MKFFDFIVWLCYLSCLFNSASSTINPAQFNPVLGHSFNLEEISQFSQIVPGLLNSGLEEHKSILQPIFETLLNQAIPLYEIKPKLSGECSNYIQNMMLMENTTSTLMMILYSGKGFNEIGTYSMCLMYPTTNKYVLIESFMGQYNLPLVNMAICGPIQCTSSDYDHLLGEFLFNLIYNEFDGRVLPFIGKVTVQRENLVFVDVGQINEKNMKTSGLAIFGYVLGCALIIMCVIGTWYEMYQGKGKIQEVKESFEVEGSEIEESPKPLQKEKGFKGFALCFSFANNGFKLLYDDASDKNLNALNGAVFFSLCWYIFGAITKAMVYAPTTNFNHIEDTIKTSFWFSFITSSELSLDVLFFICAFLSTLYWLKELQGPYSPKIVLILKGWLRRFIFQLPVYATALIFIIAITPILFDGPINCMNQYQSQNCQTNAAANIFYLNNFLALDNPCMQWTWFLACEFQFFIIGSLLIWLYHKSKTSGIIVMIILAVASIIVQAVLIAKYSLSTSYYYPDQGDIFKIYAEKPYCRINTYLLGILFGWIYCSQNEVDDFTSWRCLNSINKAIKSKVLRYCLYVVGFAMTFVAVFVNFSFQKKYDQISTFENVLYIILAPPIFVLGFVFMVYPMLLEKGKPICSVLGAPFFRPLAKITLGAFIFSLIIFFTEAYAEQTGYYLTTQRSFMAFLQITFLSYIFSLIIYLVFQAPIHNIQTKYLLSSFGNKPKTIGYESLNQNNSSLFTNEKE